MICHLTSRCILFEFHATKNVAQIDSRPFEFFSHWFCVHVLISSSIVAVRLKGSVCKLCKFMPAEHTYTLIYT